MAKCVTCGKTFDVSDARREYEAEFKDFEYDEEHGGAVCGGCAGAQTQSEMNTGRAVLMMSGDEDYDDDFVQEWL